ncbi:MAG: glycosyltransferase [Anaerolineae bacterium]|uniref:glycosyltransferase n=2 Tax=Thermoflexus sp. TaxID=1969742 RepID=UPI0025F85E39|nr:glycosyltransferase [Thermoflexus sp.]MCS7350353.1 glycosyltransferase family 4 protein [Thermoflexus sp.]MDW8179804.1 glycosyltransferase [Anaerolineae bacterium]
MRILMLTQVLPYPLVSGPQIKTHYTLRYLAQRHQITLVSFVRSEAEALLIPMLHPYCEAVHTIRLPRSRFMDGIALLRAWMTGDPFIIARDYHPAFYRLLNTLQQMESFDAVHADQLNMAPYGLAMQTFRVLDAHNAVWRVVERLAQTLSPGLAGTFALWEARRLKAYEGRVCRSFDRVLTVSHEDRQALEEAAGCSLPGAVMPIALDPADFPPIPRDRNARGVLYIGGLHWPPNVEGIRWFLREIWPLVCSKIQDARLFLVGARPPRDLQAWATRDPSVVVTGFVADAVPYWRQSALMIAPLRAGSGVRVKILEAWSRGVPVVSTSIGCEGLRACHGENIWIADEPEEFARAIVTLLRDPMEAQRLGEAGSATVQTWYDYRVAYRVLDEIYP